MTTAKILSLIGKIYWANALFIPDEFRGNKQWKAQITLDEENLEKFRNARTRIKEREAPESDENEVMVQFTRPTGKVYQSGPVDFDPPLVQYDDGSKFRERIGNGSLVRVESLLFLLSDGSGEHAHRLERVVVLDHIPYIHPAEAETAHDLVPSDSEPQLKPVF